MRIGNQLVVQRLEAGVWTTRGTFGSYTTDRFIIEDGAGSLLFINSNDNTRTLIKPSIDDNGVVVGNAEGRVALIYNNELLAVPFDSSIVLVDDVQDGVDITDAGVTDVFYEFETSRVASIISGEFSFANVISGTTVRASFETSDGQILAENVSQFDFDNGDGIEIFNGINLLPLRESIPFSDGFSFNLRFQFSSPVDVQGSNVDLALGTGVLNGDNLGVRFVPRITIEYYLGEQHNVLTNLNQQTIENKTLDIDNNVVSNIEIDNFKSTAIQEGISGDNTKLTTKAYVDQNIVSSLNYKGGYDAFNNIPDLEISPLGVVVGDFYTVTTSGLFFTQQVEVGDAIIAEADDASALLDWTVLNRALDADTIKNLYESNANTNAYTDIEKKEVEDQSSYLHSMCDKQQELTLVVDGTSVYLDVEAIDGGDIEYNLDGTYYVLDCTTGDGVGGKARVELLQGTEASPKTNYVYVAYSEQDTSIKLFTSEIEIEGAYAYVSYVGIQDYTSVSTNGALFIQRTTEAYEHNEKGAIAWMREKLRVQGTEYWTGVDQHFTITTNAGSEDNIDFHVTEGIIYQLHRQDFPEMQVSTNGIYVVNASGLGSLSEYEKILDLSVLKEDNIGNTIQDGEITNIMIFGAINHTEDSCKLFVNLPSGFYTNETNARADILNYTDYTIPKEARTTGFLIARLCLKYETANNGTWTNILTDESISWDEEVVSVTSPNYPSNYPPNSDVTTTLTSVGKETLRVYFDDFKTEANYDFVYLMDGSDNVIHTYSGTLGSFTSGEVQGDTIKIRFTSDFIINRKGFNITRLEGKLTDVSGSSFVDLRGFKPTYKLGGSIGDVMLDHNELSNIQGGIGGEYYHLEEEQVIKLNNISENHAGDSWVSGLQITESNPKGQTVDYTSGSYLINGIVKTVSTGGTYDMENGYGGVNHYLGMVDYQHRLIGIYVDTDEVIKTVAGLVAEKKEIADLPIIPNDSVCLAIVEIKVDRYDIPKDIGNKDIEDCRLLGSFGTDEHVKASADDETVGYLIDKLSNNGNVKFTLENVGGDETIKADYTSGISGSFTYNRLAVQAYQFTDVTGINSDTQVIWDDNEIDPDSAYNATTGQLTIPQSWIDDYDYMVITMSIRAGIDGVADTKLTNFSMYYNNGSTNELYMRDGHSKLKTTESQYNLLNLTTAKLYLSNYTSGDYFYAMWEDGAPYAEILGGHDNFIQVELIKTVTI